jgi:uncharacterized damage-inducible protein DinB
VARGERISLEGALELRPSPGIVFFEKRSGRTSMKRSFGLALLLSFVLFAAPFSSLAAPAEAAKAAPKAAAVKGFRGEFLAQLKDVEEKLTSLAEAVPADKFSWHPAEGVRSVSEVYMHVASGNYFILGFVGAKAPEGTGFTMEKDITEKKDVIAALKKSMEHARKAVASMNDADLDKGLKLFGQETTYRGTLLLLSNHMHEHLGQSIAYARMIGVVPPWSRSEGKGN